MNGVDQKSTHPLKKLLYDCEKHYIKIGGEPPEERQELLYVFGQEQRVSIRSYTVKVLAFAGITENGSVSVLPLFLYAETTEDAPWTDILEDLSKYCEYDFLILAEYGKAIVNALQELQLNIKHCTIVAYVPENAVKYVLETAYREFETEFKKYWHKCGPIQVSVFSEIESIAETCIKKLTECFDGKSFLKETDIIASAQPVIEAIKTGTPRRIFSDASEKVSGSSTYCIAFEKNCFETGSRRRIVVFFACYEGAVKKAVVTILPDQADNAIWEKAILGAADIIGQIGYLLFCGCSVNLWTINKGILPSTKWCVSIADFDHAEKYSDITKQSATSWNTS